MGRKCDGTIGPWEITFLQLIPTIIDRFLKGYDEIKNNQLKWNPTYLWGHWEAAVMTSVGFGDFLTSITSPHTVRFLIWKTITAHKVTVPSFNTKLCNTLESTNKHCSLCERKKNFTFQKVGLILTSFELGF